MSLSTRLLYYTAALFLGAVLCMFVEYQKSLADYEHDKSSMAVWGFLPFILPIFLMYSAMFVGPTAIVVELVLFFWRMTFRQ